MLILGPTDTLSGSARSASAITCALFGDAVTDGLDAFCVLYQGTLPTIPGALLAAGESQRLVKTIQLANITNSAVRFDFFINGVTSANLLVSMEIPSFGSASFGQDGWRVFDSRGNLLTSTAPPEAGSTLALRSEIAASLVPTTIPADTVVSIPANTQAVFRRPILGSSGSVLRIDGILSGIA